MKQDIQSGTLQQARCLSAEAQLVQTLVRQQEPSEPSLMVIGMGLSRVLMLPQVHLSRKLILEQLLTIKPLFWKWT